MWLALALHSLVVPHIDEYMRLLRSNFDPDSISISSGWKGPRRPVEQAAELEDIPRHLRR